MIRDPEFPVVAPAAEPTDATTLIAGDTIICTDAVAASRESLAERALGLDFLNIGFLCSDRPDPNAATNIKLLSNRIINEVKKMLALIIPSAKRGAHTLGPIIVSPKSHCEIEAFITLGDNQKRVCLTHIFGSATRQM